MELEFSKYFSKLVEEKGIKSIKLGELLGVTNPFVSYLKTGKKLPSDEMLEKIFKVFNVKDKTKQDEIKEMVKRDEKAKKAERIGINIKKIDKRFKEEATQRIKLPVFGFASAGNGALIYEDFEEETFLLPLDMKIPRESFILRVHGDSMEPALYDEDRIMVDPTECTEYPMLLDKIVVVDINNERFVKKVKINKESYIPEFHSLNENYPPIRLENGDNVLCVGVVTDLVKRNMRKIKF